MTGLHSLTTEMNLDAVKDCIAALVQRERRDPCPDYLLHLQALECKDEDAVDKDKEDDKEDDPYGLDDSIPRMTASSLLAAQLLVEECANLVTDQGNRSTTDSKGRRSTSRRHRASPASSTSSSTSTYSSFSLMKNLSKSSSMKDVREVDFHHPEPSSSYYSSTSSSSSLLTADSFRFCRQQMFDWACLVIDHFEMERDLVAMSFALLDRYLAKEIANASTIKRRRRRSMKSRSTSFNVNRADSPVPSAVVMTRQDFQLYSMTCLYLVVKLMNPYPRKLSVEALAAMSRGYFTTEDVESTERNILVSLGWHVHVPTALSFAQLICRLLLSPFEKDKDDKGANRILLAIHATCTTLTELTVSDSFFIPYDKYLVGSACVVMASRLHGVPERRLEEVMTCLNDHILPVHLSHFSTDSNSSYHNNDHPLASESEWARIYRQLELLYS